MNERAARIYSLVNRHRLIETAKELISIPSPTGDAGTVADRLAAHLAQDGFAVERPVGGHEPAPAVVVRLQTNQPGRTLQFNGHLDTVHLPFVPPVIEGDLIRGSGACDMKGGVAALVEALRVMRDGNLLPGGSILFTAYDLHEAPWGRGQQLNQLIAEGFVGDGVLIPEPLFDRLPTAGRGSATWKARIRRDGPPVHEVMRPAEEPSVILAGARLVDRLHELNLELSELTDPVADSESVFVGQIHSGEIFNQYPQECFLEGTRRWLPGNSAEKVESQFRQMVSKLEMETGTSIELDYALVRDSFFLDEEDPLVAAFQQAAIDIGEKPLETGPKPFVDDGNSFWSLGRIPAITHGPRSGGQHTVDEWVSIEDLMRVVALYVRIAIDYCPS